MAFVGKAFMSHYIKGRMQQIIDYSFSFISKFINFYFFHKKVY